MKDLTRKIDTTVHRRTYSVLVENEPGVLARIVGLFSARGYNIVSLAVGETLDRSVSRMTIVAEGTPAVLEQINKQLNKVIPVISVKDLVDGEFVSRELILIKILKSDRAKSFIESTREKQDWKIIDESPEHFIVQVVVSADDVAKVMDSLNEFDPAEMCRTGQIALSKKYKIGVIGDVAPADVKKIR